MLLIWALLLCGLSASAKVYDRLVLKDGSVVEGYIISQHPGKDVTFRVERAVCSLRAEFIASIEDCELALNQLSPEWQAWAAEHPSAVKTTSSGQALVLSRVTLNTVEAVDSVATVDEASADSVAVEVPDRPERDGRDVAPADMPVDFTAADFVRILERGPMVKYLDLTGNICEYRLQEIARMERLPREADLLTGLTDVVETRAGQTYEGQLVEQQPGQSVRVLTADGVVQVVNARDIASRKRKAANAGQDIFEQTPFLDVVVTADQEYQGIVTVQNYGTAKEPAYLCLLEKTGLERRIPVKTIKEMRNVENSQYRPIKKLHIGASEYYLCQQKAKTIPVTKDTKNNLLIVSQEDIADHLVLSAVAINRRLVVEMQNVAENQSVILLPIGVKAKGKELLTAFTYEELVTAAIPEVSTMVVDDGQVLRKEYDVHLGSFVLYHSRTGTVNFFEVK